MKKGQAAMEFLMTYGWAILVVLIAIGALAYFGVLNTSRFLPESCTIAPGIGCKFQVPTDDLTLRLTNGMGQDVTNLNVVGSTCDTADANADGDDGWNNGVELSLTLTGCDGKTGRFRDTLTVSFTDADSFNRTKTGEVVGVVE